MKEYNDAKRELDAAYRTAKAELAVKVRPVFYQQFSEFFVKYPEISYIRFALSSSIYNDEDYSSGIENLDFGIAELFNTPEFRDIEDDYQWEDLYYEMKETHERVGASLLATFSSEDRIKEVAQAIKNICDMIYHLDIDFLQTTFDDNCVVRITPTGFDVEK